ncbi:hypothetical protein [Rhodanobacter hydrolyticus]|uniref:Uncharacterized protein n=1 Tax=Rhodanobacter hydrolyticus TaxID=2250595 RepID=A0ABW8J8U6_9GAMM
MIDLTSLSNNNLLKLYSEIEQEARRRDLSLNIGELGERLVIELFKRRTDLPVLGLASKGTKNVDALSRDGERYSIKTLQRARKTGTIYPDSENKDKQLFEFLVIVILTDSLELSRVVILSWNQFCRVRSWDRRMNAWYVGRSKRALDLGRQVFPHPIDPHRKALTETL